MKSVTQRHSSLCAFVIVLAESVSVAATTDKTDGRLPYHAGVTLAGPEFGLDERGLSNASPGVHGVDYVYNSPATTRAVAKAGFTLVRLPFRWERLQPTLGGPLDTAELGRLTAAVDVAGRAGLRVVLDLHNYGRYRLATRTGVVEAVIDQRVAGKPLLTRDHLADVWWRLAERFGDHDAVLAYALMNEPHDMGSSSWRAISQHTVEAVREVDSRTWLLVAGDEWSHAHRFGEVNGRHAWITDPANRTAYEAHCYLDHDASGKHQLSYGDEMRLDPELRSRARRRLEPFLEWLDRNGVSGVLGETGAPLADPGWRSLLADLTQTAAEKDVPVVLWAAGEWWGDYPLSVQPLLDAQVESNPLLKLGLVRPQAH